MAASRSPRIDARLHALALCVGLAVVGGCTGTLTRPNASAAGAAGTGAPPAGSAGTAPPGTAGANGAAGTAAAGAGAAGMTAGPGDLPLPRLARDEYIQTIRDLVKQVNPAADVVVPGILNLTGDLPSDALVTISTEKHGGFARADQTEQQQYSDVSVTVGMALGAALTSTPARIAALFGTCSNAGAAVDGACLRAFVKSFGEIALRHPLSDDDVAFYAATAATDPPSVADLGKVIGVMLSSPRFLYRVESGGELVAPNTYRLDAWELAARLSYHFWGTMPDATLRAAAASGKLLTDAGYASEVERLVGDPRADTTLRSFFQQWLWPLLELPPLDSRASDPVFKAFAGTNLPGPTLRAHMVADVLDAANWVMTHGGGVPELLTNRLSFARDADLAAIYGVPAWNGMGDPPMLPPARAGLLTRAALLSTGTVNTRPIMKGVFIRTTLLCDGVPPPPPDAANTPIKSSAGQTTREVIESITEATGTACVGCHRAFINPLGFATENFDGLGRERAQQTFFDDMGAPTGSKPVLTTSTPGIAYGDKTASTGAGDLTRLIVESGKVEKCLATQLFRYAFRRMEGPGDKPAVDGLAQMAAKGKLVDLFKGVALRPEFKQRVITP